MSMVFAPPSPPPPAPPPIPQAAPEPPPHKAHWWTHQWLKTPLWAWIIIVVFGIGLIGTLASPKAKNSLAAQQPAATAPRVTTPAPKVTQATPTTVAPTTVAPTTVPPTTTPPSIKAQFTTWLIDNAVQTRSQGLTDAMGGAADATTATEMGAVCEDVHDANEWLHDALPSPSPEYNQAMEQVYVDYDTATHYCIDGAATMDITKLNMASDYLKQGTADIKAATAVIQAM